MGPKEFRWLVLGFAAATLVAAITQAQPAVAQSEAASRPEASVPVAAVAARRPAPAEDDPVETDEEDEDGADRRRPGDRVAPVDGDLAFPAEPEAPLDGDPGAAEPAGPIDGADPVAIDMRDDADRSLFETPPVGFDPLLFQIEELDPILDRRPERLFRLEPYDPVGVKVGSFVYFPEAEIAGAYFSNVFSSPLPEADGAVELRTNSRLVSNWSVHALELRSSSFTSFHGEFDSEDDRDWDVEARGRLDMTRRTNLQAAAGHARSLESRQAIDASAAGDRTPIETTTGETALTHRFNRVTAQLRASVADLDYGDAADGLGAIVDNDDRDTRVHEETVRIAYELKPSFAVFAEVGLDQRGYKVANFSDGFLRDSEGQRYRLGIDFGGEGQILRGEMSFGYGLQTPDEAALEETEGFLFDANVTWRVTELTALRLVGRTDFFDTQREFAGNVLSHAVGLEARHAFRRYFIGTAGIGYLKNDYTGVDFEEDYLTFNLDAEYYANPEVVLFGRYEHTTYWSSEPESDYEADEVRVGLRLRR